MEDITITKLTEELNRVVIEKAKCAKEAERWEEKRRKALREESRLALMIFDKNYSIA